MKHQCKVCCDAQSKSYAQRYWKSKIQPKTRGYRWKHKYGLTETEFRVLFDRQEGRCSICKMTLFENGNGFTGVVVDHHHGSGKIRGLLCGLCNSGLGHFRDNPNFLEAAIEYLRKNS
jgi:hypothetical protein